MTGRRAGLALLFGIGGLWLSAACGEGGPSSAPGKASTSAPTAVSTTSASPVPTTSATTPATQAPSTRTNAPSVVTTAFDRTQFSRDDPGSLWVVVNKTRPLTPLRYVPPDLVNVEHGQTLRFAVATAFRQMKAAAAADGAQLGAYSGYRSYSHQTGVYADVVRSKGQAAADRSSARPGYSEHQTGLALDVGSAGCIVADCFADTRAGRWVAAQSWRYGFVVRYPAGYESITGFRYEPWHLRYVGVALATEMHRTGVSTLEQFFGLPAAPHYR